MAKLDINGYNATFRTFTNFAQQRVDANGPENGNIVINS